MSNISAKAQKAIEEAVAGYPDKWRNGVCAFHCINRETGEEWSGNKTNGACHASISYLYRDVDARMKSIVVNAHKFHWHQEHPEFMRWLAHEAPFHHGVLNADNEKEFFEHASVIDMGIVGNGGALFQCKAMRHFTEDTWKLQTWDKLRECGLNGLQAYVGADILDMSGGPMHGSHVATFSYTSPVKLRRDYDFFNGKKRLERGDVARPRDHGAAVWGTLKHRTEKKSDGWGGFIEVKRPCDAKDYAAQLKEIFEGDPKNVG